MRDVKERYFNWMREIVCGGKPYYMLCQTLHDIYFTPLMDMDENRAADGVDLRYRFGYEHHLSQAEVAAELDDISCTVFEMMVALAINCEQIVKDSYYGDRTEKWFLCMLKSLGIDDMTDTYHNFNERKIRKAIQVFLDRDYAADGRGGLFTIHNCKKDLRTIDIWYQAMWFLDEVIDDE